MKKVQRIILHLRHLQNEQVGKEYDSVINKALVRIEKIKGLF